MTVEIVPVAGLPEFAPGDDVGARIAEAASDLHDGDVVAVTQKIVSKAEGRVVREEGGDRSAWVERETRRVVARRGDLVIAETRHGFVCANAGVDASNVAEGWLTLLPEDPDASAARIRTTLLERLGVDVGVVITDPFGRPWREGLVNVAIGCAGLPAVVDLRGSLDHHGRTLEATVVALADEVAAASGLVMGKAARAPVAIVRGIEIPPAARPTDARALIRDPRDDLFRLSPMWLLASAREATTFQRRDVPLLELEPAIEAASARDPSIVWTVVTTDVMRRRLVAAAGDDVLVDAPVLVLPLVPALPPEDARTSSLLSAGAAIERFGLAIVAQGLTWWWSRTALTHPDAVAAAADRDAGSVALGVIGVG